MRLELIPATDADRWWIDGLRRAVYRDLFFATWGGWDEARHLRHSEACWARGSICVVEVDGVRVGMMSLLGFQHTGRTATHDLLECAP